MKRTRGTMKHSFPFPRPRRSLDNEKVNYLAANLAVHPSLLVVVHALIPLLRELSSNRIYTTTYRHRYAVPRSELNWLGRQAGQAAARPVGMHHCRVERETGFRGGERDGPRRFDPHLLECVREKGRRTNGRTEGERQEQIAHLSTVFHRCISVMTLFRTI